MVLQTGKHRECCAGPPGAFARPSVPVSLSESAKAHAAVLGSAPGVGRHFILGVAGITFANPGTVTVSLAVAHGNVAAVVPDSPANQGHRPAIQTTVWGMKDREIIAAIVAGDPAGLAGVYDKYAESLYGYCRWMLGGSDCAADTVQDTFVIAAASLGGPADPLRLRPWLYAVARNECYRRLRAGKRASMRPPT